MPREYDIAKQMCEKHIDLLALMPCPLKVPFEKILNDYVEKDEEYKAKDLNFMIEGHANHHLSFYKEIADVNEIECLPDIMITPGINALFGKKFREKFVEKGYFQLILPKQINSLAEEARYLDPRKQYSMFAMNILVMVVYKPTLPTERVPQTLEELLAPEYQDKIVLRGQKGNYCESVLLSFDHLFGEVGIRKLAENTAFGCHPSEMIRMIRTGHTEGGAVFIMPYFYAKTMEKDTAVEIIWPKEGAIVNAISMLVKKDIGKAGKKIAEFIVGEEVAKVCEGAFFPSTYRLQEQDSNKKLLWMGWDYIYQSTMTERLEALNQLFEQKEKQSE